MRIASVGIAAAALVTAASAWPQSDAVDPWQSEPPPAAAASPKPDARDPWVSQTTTPPPPPGKPAKVVKKAPPPAAVKKRVVLQPVPRALQKKGARSPDEPIAWFPGFLRLQGGVTRVFLEVSKKVEITEHRGEGRLTYRLKGVDVPDRTNRLPLLTGFIATPVDRVQLVPDGPDADLVIDLREPSEASYRVIDTPRGIVLQVDFPPNVKRVEHAIQRDSGDNGAPVAPTTKRLSTSTTRIHATDSAY
ncbi:MAG TPA: hypothetical protein VHB21_23975 [Minicystis sp.]|nr:hypothetical protein [Minicystis sp.]